MKLWYVVCCKCVNFVRYVVVMDAAETLKIVFIVVITLTIIIVLLTYIVKKLCQPRLHVRSDKGIVDKDLCQEKKARSSTSSEEESSSEESDILPSSRLENMQRALIKEGIDMAPVHVKQRLYNQISMCETLLDILTGAEPLTNKESKAQAQGLCKFLSGQVKVLENMVSKLPLLGPYTEFDILYNECRMYELLLCTVPKVKDIVYSATENDPNFNVHNLTLEMINSYCSRKGDRLSSILFNNMSSDHGIS
ncbi:hypothetical protein FDZ61_03980 [Ehrlichia ruminantium]|uniref:Uncharacterized protein n=2 Tax=Ehrlichia ruminantium TaxID=779 RepID=A0A0H3M6L5_EHRRW|nr:hypothetical protein FDZ61_03980 [Ehrlichia ruminantium]UOD99507.1 hypothetical protein IMW62_03945 [Ehrlichia ruminantium]CAH58442.1 putative membrane protein [Ehrlichia ruminantium str. Welgevonden]CAI27239.1 Hypothetical protein ERWE_CDS_07450 [Ehrlichia ruminantium str. Welgevonden]